MIWHGVAVVITVTRILSAEPSSWPMLRAICKAMGFVRADLWRRYGELQRSAERESPTL